jgi:hypothetical protein
MNARTIRLALTVARDYWFADGSVAPGHEEQATRAWRKLWASTTGFFRRANAEQWKELKKLWRFHELAQYGPALSTSRKRTRAAVLLSYYRLLSSLLQNPIAVPPAVFGSALYVKALRPILEAARNDSDTLFGDLEIAKTFKRNQSHVNGFLAEYSLLMVAKQPVLTFGDLHEILHWIKPADLRKRIKELRKTYGPWAVPLAPGRRGRPPQKK